MVRRPDCVNVSPLPAKTGPVPSEATSGASGPGPDDFGPVLGYCEAGPTPREAGPAGPEAASAPCGPGPGAFGPGRNQPEAGQRKGVSTVADQPVEAMLTK